MRGCYMIIAYDEVIAGSLQTGEADTMATESTDAERNDSKTERVRAKALAEGNPGVDLGMAAEALKMVRTLREMGVEGAEYDLRSPYGPRATHSASEGVWSAPPAH
jgi:hypothetical protein